VLADLVTTTGGGRRGAEGGGVPARLAPMALVQTSITNGVATLTLDNPSERNTLTAPMVAEILAAMDTIESDESVGALVVTGAAPAFCAGANLGNLAEASGESLGTIYEGFLRIARSPLPTLAAVNGAAVGAGMNLALGCDVRIAARRAKFDTRFLQIGIHPGGGHTWMLRRIVGPQSAMATVVFGQVLDGAEAERIGLAYRCVDDDDLLPTAQAMAEVAASAPRELAITVKATIAAMADVHDHPTAVQRELEPQLWSTRQPWFAERLAALQRKISKK
jgi:enoyl-CoA hydratase